MIDVVLTEPSGRNHPFKVAHPSSGAGNLEAIAAFQEQVEPIHAVIDRLHPFNNEAAKLGEPMSQIIGAMADLEPGQARDLVIPLGGTVGDLRVALKHT